MNIIISLLIGLFSGVIIGFGLAVIMAAAGRYDDEQALSAALADAKNEIVLVRRENGRLHDQIATLSITLNATRDRGELLAELSREMNQ